MPVPNVELTTEWLDALRGYRLHLKSLNRSAGTIAGALSAASIIGRHAVAAGLTDPRQVTKGWLKGYMVEQFDARKNTGALNHHQKVKCFWDWFSAEEDVASPMAAIPRPKGKAPTPPVLSPKELDAILGACNGKGWAATRNRALVLLALESGLRRFELSALDLDSVDLDARTVTVLRGKGRKARMSVFGDETAMAIHRWLRRRNQAGCVHPTALFTSRLGGRLTPSGINQLLTRIGEQARVPGLRPHLFRHCWTHFMLADGVQEHDIMRLAGWSNTVQLARYGAALAEQRAIAAGLSHQVARIARGES